MIIRFVVTTMTILLAIGGYAPHRSYAQIPTGQQATCQPIYGGGITCLRNGTLQIDKKVINPQTGTFVENLSGNDPKFNTGQEIRFQLTATNTSNQTLQNVTVRDVFPQYVTFVSGDGRFDERTRTFTWSIETLPAREPKTIVLVGRIVNANQLPQNRDVLCVVNQAQTAVGDTQSQDNAQFCIQKPQGQQESTGTPGTTKGGLPVGPASDAKEIPATGPAPLALLTLIPSALVGVYLRKKAK